MKERLFAIVAAAVLLVAVTLPVLSSATVIARGQRRSPTDTAGANCQLSRRRLRRTDTRRQPRAGQFASASMRLSRRSHRTGSPR